MCICVHVYAYGCACACVCVCVCVPKDRRWASTCSLSCSSAEMLACIARKFLCGSVCLHVCVCVCVNAHKIMCVMCASTHCGLHKEVKVGGIELQTYTVSYRYTYMFTSQCTLNMYTTAHLYAYRAYTHARAHNLTLAQTH